MPSDDSSLPDLPVSDSLLVEIVGTTLVVTLHRPDRANALEPTIMTALRTLWAAAADRTDIRAIVLTGGGRAFCAGADVDMLADDRTDVGADAAAELSFVPGPTVHVPVIVAVNGVCAGGGLHFVADADICIAAEEARFIDPHVSVGQVSGLEPIELLLRARRDTVVRMALLGRGETLSAAAALRAGLVSEVHPSDELLPAAMRLAERIAAGSPAAIRETRRMIRAFDADLLRPHLDRGWRAVQDHWSHPDSKEGPHAFMEKRPPRWLPD